MSYKNKKLGRRGSGCGMRSGGGCCGGGVGGGGCAGKKRGGFTLTEVLVGVMVLVIAVVASSNLLVSMIRSNIANTNMLKAYYLSQEGLEAFRNMRDTHFMHNLSYRGQKGANLWGLPDGFEYDGDYGVVLNENTGGGGKNVTQNELNMFAPWRLSDGKVSVGKTKEGEDFTRVCKVETVEVSKDLIKVLAVNSVLSSAFKVTCTTMWEESSDTKSFSLSTILTDWKNE